MDDDHDLCHVLSYALQNLGFKVLTFHSGEDTLQFFAQQASCRQPTLLILDRLLPDCDGSFILRKIRDKFPDTIQAIFLSSLATEKDVIEGLKSGACDYITKPFNLSILLQKSLLLLHA